MATQMRFPLSLKAWYHYEKLFVMEYEIMKLKTDNYL